MTPPRPMSEATSRPAPAAAEAAPRVFPRGGFVVMPGLFDREEVHRISAWTDELQALPERPGHCMMYFEPSLLEPGKRALPRIADGRPFHSALPRAPPAALRGAPAVLFKDKITVKRPGGDGFKPHQDQRAGWSSYADLFVTA